MSENHTNHEWVVVCKGPYVFKSLLDLHIEYPDGIDETHGLKANECAVSCFNCGHIKPVTDCSYCGGSNFKLGIDNSGRVGLFCINCRNGFVNSVCPCGSNNYITDQNLMKIKKSGCFIASAVYGSSVAHEVIYLSSFRDEILNNYSIGRGFVKAYYLLSPFIAQMIGNSVGLKFLTKYLLILPLIFCVKTLRKIFNIKIK